MKDGSLVRQPILQRHHRKVAREDRFMVEEKDSSSIDLMKIYDKHECASLLLRRVSNFTCSMLS